MQKNKKNRNTPNVRQNIARITTVGQVFMTNGPELVENIQAGDGWATAATVCTMISGVTAVIPHPASLVASALFGVVAFLIKLGTKKTVEQESSSRDRYAEINEKIEQAVIRIQQHDRTIELSKLMAPLTLAQEISEQFLPISGERMKEGEFRYWLWSNNVPNMNCFVDSMAIIESYLKNMAPALKKDGTHKTLTMVYLKIAIIRDIVLTGVDLIFPDIPDLKSLREAIRASLNRQKKHTFKFLSKYRKPRAEQLSIIGWAYPPSRNDKEVNMLHAYLNGLSYLDEKDEVDLLPPVTVNAEILKVAHFKIKLTRENKPTVTLIYKVTNTEKVKIQMGEEKHETDYFTFEPDEEGYAKIKFMGQLPARLQKRYPAEETRYITLDMDGVQMFKTDWRREVVQDDRKFHIILLNSEGSDDDTLKFALGRKKDGKGEKEDDTHYLKAEDYDYGANSKGTGVYFKEVGITSFDLVLDNKDDTLATLKRDFKELDERLPSENLVDMGDTFYSMNEALYFCQLVGKCIPKVK